MPYLYPALVISTRLTALCNPFWGSDTGPFYYAVNYEYDTPPSGGGASVNGSITKRPRVRMLALKQ